MCVCVNSWQPADVFMARFTAVFRLVVLFDCGQSVNFGQYGITKNTLSNYSENCNAKKNYIKLINLSYINYIFIWECVLGMIFLY